MSWGLASAVVLTLWLACPCAAADVAVSVGLFMRLSVVPPNVYELTSRSPCQWQSELTVGRAQTTRAVTAANAGWGGRAL